jgi:hypothetical protein
MPDSNPSASTPPKAAPIATVEKNRVVASKPPEKPVKTGFGGGSPVYNIHLTETQPSKKLGHVPK